MEKPGFFFRELNCYDITINTSLLSVQTVSLYLYWGPKEGFKVKYRKYSLDMINSSSHDPQSNSGVDWEVNK